MAHGCGLWVMPHVLGDSQGIELLGFLGFWILGFDRIKPKQSVKAFNFHASDVWLEGLNSRKKKEATGAPDFLDSQGKLRLFATLP